MNHEADLLHAGYAGASLAFALAVASVLGAFPETPVNKTTPVETRDTEAPAAPAPAEATLPQFGTSVDGAPPEPAWTFEDAWTSARLALLGEGFPPRVASRVEVVLVGYDEAGYPRARAVLVTAEGGGDLVSAVRDTEAVYQR